MISPYMSMCHFHSYFQFLSKMENGKREFVFDKYFSNIPNIPIKYKYKHVFDFICDEIHIRIPKITYLNTNTYLTPTLVQCKESVGFIGVHTFQTWGISCIDNFSSLQAVFRQRGFVCVCQCVYVFPLDLFSE